MAGREIIIADGDSRYRSQVTDFFRKGGYRVATADSVEQVLASVQESHPQVLLLGSCFSTKISAPDLICLLKKCSRKLRIIMVSDELSLAQARQVRQEGIFYHALKPATAADTEELGQAVACAFDKRRKVVPGDPSPNLQRQQELTKTDGGAAPAGPGQASSLSAAVAIGASLLATSYLLMGAAPNQAHGGAGLAGPLFLGFCALIVARQSLPIFRIRPGPATLPSRHATQVSTPRYGQ